MKLWHSYHIAKGVDDALQALGGQSENACVIAGGTDLLLDLQQGRRAPVALLVDVTRIPELNRLEVRENDAFIGAGVPLNRVIDAAWVASEATALFEACSLIGGPQVRNTATLGGNVGHALPAADGTIALLASAGMAELAGPYGRRHVPVEELFLGPGKSALLPGKELLVGFHLPRRQAGQGSAFRRVMRPQGVAIAILNMGMTIWRERDLVGEIRIAVGPAGPVPFRARQTEMHLRGKAPTPEILKEAAATLLQEASFRTSPHRATAEYRRRMAVILYYEVFQSAWRRTFSGE